MTTIRFIIAITIGGIAVLCALALWFMPDLTRRDLYFGVTVAPGFRDEPGSKSILRRYRIELTFVSALALVVFVTGVTYFGVGFVSAGLFIQLGASFIPFYRARQRVLPYAVPPTMVREAELDDYSRIIPSGWIVALGPFILLAASAGYLWIHPTTAGTHFTSHWRGEQSTGSSFQSLSIYLLSIGGLLAGLTLILYGLAHWVRPVHASGPRRARELKFRRTVSTILIANEYYIALQTSWIVLVPHRHDLTAVGLIPFAFVFALVAIIVLARLGQGGSRMPVADETQLAGSTVPVGDRTPDRYWKLGIFYFNRDDPAVLMEKRFGLGYSLNFARSTAWIILLLVLMGPLVPILARLYW